MKIPNTNQHIQIDNIFINHIKSHLKEDEEVICKICGKTAKEIIEEEKGGGKR